MEEITGQWLSYREALPLLEEFNFTVTDSGLCMQGLRYGFTRKASDGFHWEYSKEALLEYLKARSTTPEKGWLSIKKASLQSAIPMSTLYWNIKRGTITTRPFGRSNVAYVKWSDVKNLTK